MGYRWAVHQELLHKLYVEDGESLDSVMHHMKEKYDFKPWSVKLIPCRALAPTYTPYRRSKRRYQSQFRTWGFIKNCPAEKNEQLVNRIKELWEANVGHAVMLDTLHAEGFRVSSTNIGRVRRKNKWYLRAPPPDITSSTPNDDIVRGASKSSISADTAPKEGSQLRQMFPRKPPSEMSKNVRFPSQVSATVARERIGIDRPTYKNMRIVFKRICKDDGIIRKTEPDISVWEAAKVKLRSEIPQLHIAMSTSKDEEVARLKQISLDVICMDIAKGMRVTKSTNSVTEVRNTLGINPEESRQIRYLFMKILEEVNFKWKSNASPEQWAELNKLWAARSPMVAKIVASREGGPTGIQARADALKAIAKNGLSRYQELNLRKAVPPATTEAVASGAPQQLLSLGTMDTAMDSFAGDSGDISFPDNTVSPDPPRQTRRSTRTAANAQPVVQLGQRRNPPKPAKTTRSNTIAAPTLPSHVHHTMQSTAPTANEQAFFVAAPSFPTTVYQQTTPAPSLFYQAPTAFAVYFRLHPSSSFASAASLWISTLRSSLLQDLRGAAASKFPGTVCLRVEGIVKDGNGGEIPLQINQDDEMMAYMEHLQGSTPTFSVQLVWKTS